jgi:hypothetical protein
MPTVMTYAIQDAVNMQLTLYIIANNQHYKLHLRLSMTVYYFTMIMYSINLCVTDAPLVIATTLRSKVYSILYGYYVKLTHQILTVH